MRNQIIKETKRKKVYSALIYLIIQSIALITPYLMGKTIDVFLPAKDLKNTLLFAVIIACIPMVSTIASTLYNYLLIKYIRKRGYQIALNIMENLVYQEMSFFDHENSLELLSYCGKETAAYLQFHLSDMGTYYAEILISVLVFLSVLRIDVCLGLLQLLYIPIAFFPTKRIIKGIENDVSQIVSLNAKSNQVKGEIIQNIKFIKTARLEKDKLNKVHEYNDRTNSVWGKVAAMESLAGAWTSAFSSVVFKGLTFALGAVFIIIGRGKLQIGQLVSAVAYAVLFYAHINSIIVTEIKYKKNESQFEKFFSLLDLENHKKEEESKQPFNNPSYIYFKNCDFSYDVDEPVFDKLNLKISMGEWTGITGASGQGKSTLFNIILKLYKVESGMVFFDDVDINEINCYSIRDNITLVSQSVSLFSGTIKDNLSMMGDGITEEQMWNALTTACLEEFIKTLPKGIDTDIGEAGALMSGGERQRLSIAMALLRGNKILLLDEITSNLNVELEQRLAMNFKKLKESGYTIVSVSHRKSFLQYADKVYLISDGKAAEAQ